MEAEINKEKYYTDRDHSSRLICSYIWLSWDVMVLSRWWTSRNLLSSFNPKLSTLFFRPWIWPRWLSCLIWRDWRGFRISLEEVEGIEELDSLASVLFELGASRWTHTSLTSRSFIWLRVCSFIHMEESTRVICFSRMSGIRDCLKTSIKIIL